MHQYAGAAPWQRSSGSNATEAWPSVGYAGYSHRRQRNCRTSCTAKLHRPNMPTNQVIWPLCLKSGDLCESNCCGNGSYSNSPRRSVPPIGLVAHTTSHHRRIQPAVANCRGHNATLKFDSNEGPSNLPQSRYELPTKARQRQCPWQFRFGETMIVVSTWRKENANLVQAATLPLPTTGNCSVGFLALSNIQGVQRNAQTRQLQPWLCTMRPKVVAQLIQSGINRRRCVNRPLKGIASDWTSIRDRKSIISPFTATRRAFSFR